MSKERNSGLATSLIVLFLFPSCFTRLAKAFKVKRNHETEVGEFSQYFPHFIWLLRDVSLITSDDGQGGEMDPTEYIKTKVSSFYGIYACSHDVFKCE